MSEQSTPVASKTRRALLILCAVALVVHLASAVGIFMFRPASISTTPDPLYYRLTALNLLDNHIFSVGPPSLNVPEVLRTPGYPLVLAATYAVDGGSGLLILILQTFMLVGSGLLLFRLLKRFSVGDTLALVLTGLLLFEPLEWLYTLHTMTETLSSFLIIALLALAITPPRRKRTLLLAAGYGALLGFLILVKPSGLMWAPFLLGLLLVGKTPFARRLRMTALAAVAALLVLSPWMLRNFDLVGAPIISSSADLNIVRGLGGPAYVPAIKDFVGTVTDHGHVQNVNASYSSVDYPEVHAAETSIIAQDGYLNLAWKQVACAPKVWFGHEYGLIASFVLGKSATRDAYLSVADNVFWAILLALFLFGTFRILRRPSELRPAFLLMLAMLLATLFINACIAWTRMLLPLYPIIFVGIAVALTDGARYLKRKQLPE